MSGKTRKIESRGIAEGCFGGNAMNRNDARPTSLAVSAGSRIFVPITDRELKGTDMSKFWRKNRTPAQRARLCRKECGGVETCQSSDACINWPSAAQQEWLSANK